MCPPLLAIAGIGMSAAGSLMNYSAQSAQADAQTQEYNQNVAAARRAFADTNHAINVQQMQQQDATAMQIQENDLKTRAAQATARAGAAAGGVQGLSLEEVMGDYGAQDMRANSAARVQEQWDIEQGQNQKVAAGDQMASRANSMTPGIQPSPLGAILGIGQAAIGGMTDLNRIAAQNGGQGGFNFGNLFGTFSGLQMGVGSA